MLSSTASTRAELNMLVAGYATAAAGLVAPRVFPVFNSPGKVGRFWKVQPGSLLEAPDTKRAPGTTYKRNIYEVTDDTYTCVAKGLEGLVPAEQSAEFADIFPLEQARARQKTLEILRREELDLSGMLFSRTTFPAATATGSDVTDEWDDHANAVPVTNVNTALNQLATNIGNWTGLGLKVCGLCNKSVKRNLSLCTQIRSSLGGQYTNPDFAMGELPDALIAQALNLDELIVADERYMSGGSSASPTVSKIWSDEYFLVFVRADTSAPEVMGLGMTPVWTPGGGELEVSTYYSNEVNSQVVQVNRHSVHKVVHAGAGYLLGNITT